MSSTAATGAMSSKNIVENPYQKNNNNGNTNTNYDGNNKCINHNKRQRAEGDSLYESFERRSDSTIRGHETSVKKWDEFANEHNNTFGTRDVIPLFTEMSIEWACGELEAGGLYPKNFRFPPIANYMEKWCSHLFSMKKSSGDDYQPWVVVQYLSSFKTVLFI